MPKNPTEYTYTPKVKNLTANGRQLIGDVQQCKGTHLEGEESCCCEGWGRKKGARFVVDSKRAVFRCGKPSVSNDFQGSEPIQQKYFSKPKNLGANRRDMVNSSSAFNDSFVEGSFADSGMKAERFRRGPKRKFSTLWDSPVSPFSKNNKPQNNN